ncbi:MAG: MMPL family transporter [Deltaproteobacteria bacterium]|nr:MMPL family transporter [Deltaproteobacteria bacterium]
MEKLAKLIIKYRLLVVLAVLAITIFFAYFIPQLSFQVLLSELVPPKHPYIKLTGQFFEQFGGANGMIIEVKVKEGDIFNPETLQKIKRINDDILFHPDVMRALVLSMAQRKVKRISGFGGGFDVTAIMWPHTPTETGDILQLREDIFTNDLYDGFLVSRDGKAALIYAELWDGANYEKFFRFLEELKIREGDHNTTLHMAGMPVLYAWIYKFLPQTKNILLITILFFVIILFVLFGTRWQGIIIPMAVGIISGIWGLGFTSLIGNLSPLMIVLPILIGARAISHSVQLTRRYLEEYDRLGDKKAAAEATIVGLFLPSFSAIITDAAGFMVLVLAKIIMIYRLAFICTFWLFAIFLVVAILGPVLCTYLPIRKKEEAKTLEKSLIVSFFNRIHMGMARWQMGKQRFAIVGTVVVIGIVASYYAVTHLTIGDIHAGSPILWPESVYNRDCREINARFEKAGTDTLNLIVAGKDNYAMDNPQVLKRIEGYGRYIKRKMPQKVGGVQSVVSILKKLNMELHEGDPRWHILPDTMEMAGSLFDMYRSGGDPQDFDKFTDGRYMNGNVIVFMKDHTRATIDTVLSSTKEYFAGLPPIKEAEFKWAGGVIGIMAATNEEVERSQFGILLLVMIAIFFLCSITFRSVVAGVILTVPLLVANFACFAFMGLKGISLDVNTLPVAAVGIGVGVDYGIYLLSRIEEEYGKTGDLASTIHQALTTAGNGVVFTALTIIIPVGLWYFLSSLKFQAEMGLLMALLMLFNAVVALLFQPAAVFILKPKFLIKRYQK